MEPNRWVGTAWRTSMAGGNDRWFQNNTVVVDTMCLWVGGFGCYSNMIGRSENHSPIVVRIHPTATPLLPLPRVDQDGRTFERLSGWAKIVAHSSSRNRRKVANRGPPAHRNGSPAHQGATCRTGKSSISTARHADCSAVSIACRIDAFAASRLHRIAPPPPLPPPPSPLKISTSAPPVSPTRSTAARSDSRCLEYGSITKFGRAATEAGEAARQRHTAL